MESAKKRRLVATFPWRPLRAPLSDDERGALRRSLERLLEWQARLGAFPRVSWAPDATPFVSIYAHGKLRGCFGSDEGSPTERLCRAFLRALEDIRFGMVSSDERSHLAAQVSYPLDPEGYDPAHIAEHLEPGTHGVACVREGNMPVNLLPQVARDHGLDALRLLEQLGLKAGLGGPRFAGAHLFLFRTEDIAARRSRAPSRFGEPMAEARDWLARLVAPDGRIGFSIDPRSGENARSGLMRHGRAAVALRALASSKTHARVVKRAGGWLEREMACGLRGDAVEGWPDDPSVVAGTLAFGCQAGIDVLGPLSAYAKRLELASNAWHAAQVVCALGKQSPPALFRACVADLERRPWAPWTALAARVLGDAKVMARCERPLIDALRLSSPHPGGASVTDVPEIALTAVSIEALVGLRSRASRSAVARGRAFLLRWQLGSNVSASLDPGLCRGAFPASPVASLLRCDVTAHALLALKGESPGGDAS
jgi:AMMECR1 domain-containing protein